MSRETWSLIRQSKGFYVSNFRWVESALIFSVALSVILIVAINHVYFSRGAHVFYATDGITPPKKLKALDEPNYSGSPLLISDQDLEKTTRVVPQ